MKTITLELPEEVANVIELYALQQKSILGLLTARFSKSKLESLDKLFEKIDKKVLESGISDEEINKVLEEIS